MCTDTIATYYIWEYMKENNPKREGTLTLLSAGIPDLFFAALVVCQEAKILFVKRQKKLESYNRVNKVQT